MSIIMYYIIIYYTTKKYRFTNERALIGENMEQTKYEISPEQIQKIEDKIADGALFALTHRSCRLNISESMYIQASYHDDAVTSAFYAGLSQGLNYKKRPSRKKRGVKNGEIVKR